MATFRRQRPRTSLAGRSVLITGAARGIGAALARKAAAQLGVTFTALSPGDGQALATFVMKDAAYTVPTVPAP